MRSTDPLTARFRNSVAAGVLALACTAAPAQDEADPAATPVAETKTPPDFSRPPLVWPRDSGEVLAKVGGRSLTLADLVDHITERHVPSFKKFLEQPAGQLYFRSSPLVSTWVRQFADIVGLEAEARSRGVDMQAAEERLSATLKSMFEQHLAKYRERRELQGRPLELTQDRINVLLDQFQRRNGLRIELQGWLDHLTDDEPNDRALYDFFGKHAALISGRVTLSHILIENRDRKLSRRFNEEGQRRVHERVADLKSRLAEDGSNFEELARRYSDDRKTATDGGRLHNISRFETALPAILCRIAWHIKDGEVVGPVESPYGLHFVKRIKFASADPYFLPVPKNMPRIANTRRRLAQENLIFATREKLGTEILY